MQKKLINLTPPVIGILRGVSHESFGVIMKSSFSAGLKAIEITMNTANAENIIKDYISKVPPRHLLGMGTIRNIDEAKRAIEAGAMFLVSPNTDTQVIEYANNHKIPIIAGAFTPTEIYNAWSAGASMIKIFPSNSIGADYFKEIAGPFEQIPLVAVGGVTTTNLPLFFQAGASAVGVSTSLFGKNAIKRPNSMKIKENVANFIDICLQAKKNN